MGPALEEVDSMFMAMNRFRVRLGEEKTFEEIWSTRESYLSEVDGFIAFALLRGDAREDHTLYISHSMWRSEDHFKAWTRSEPFRKAHANAGGATKSVYLGPPEFEGFTAVLVEGAHASPQAA